MKEVIDTATKPKEGRVLETYVRDGARRWKVEVEASAQATEAEVAEEAPRKKRKIAKPL